MSFIPPTPEELVTVGELRELMAKEFPEITGKMTDTTLLRFLRGRKHEFDKAHRALQRYVAWRVENDVDNIALRTDEFQPELDAKKVVTDLVDKEGRPVVHIFARRHDKTKRDIDQVRKMIIYCLEDVLKRTHPVEERIVIYFDLGGFNLKCMDYDAVHVLIDILGYNYPETLHVAYIVNSPFIFSACWAIIRPWLDPVTASKVMFVKQDQLKNYFSEENIPANH